MPLLIEALTPNQVLQKARYNHRMDCLNCRGQNTAKISLNYKNNQKKIYYCYACQMKEQINLDYKYTPETAKPITIKHLKYLNEKILLWLAKTSVLELGYKVLMEKYSLGSTDTGDLYIPLYQSGFPEKDYILRCAEGKKKYKTVINTLPKGSHANYLSNDKEETLFIVEDSLSAIKLYNLGYQAISIQGTYVSELEFNTIMEYISEAKRTLIALDPDPSGEKGGAILLKRILDQAYFDVQQITVDPEFKHQDDFEIKATLKALL